MDLVTALAVVIGIIGGIIAFVLLSLGGSGIGLMFWIVFIAAASFFSCGGGTAGLQKSLAANIWGVFICWLTLVAVVNGFAGTMGLPAWAGICVAIGTIVLILGAKIPAFSAIPSTVFGFATTAGFFLLLAPSHTALFSLSLLNPAINTGVSMVIGAAFGLVSEMIATKLVKNTPAHAASAGPQIAA